MEKKDQRKKIIKLKELLLDNIDKMFMMGILIAFIVFILIIISVYNFINYARDFKEITNQSFKNSETFNQN